jgi:hypothetical protein
VNRAAAAVATIALAATVTSACTRSTGTVVGALGYSGGPPPLTGTPAGVPPLSGTILIHRDGLLVRSVRVGDDGRFTARLVPGVYRFSEARLGCDTDARISAGVATTVQVVCSIK